MIFLTLLYVRDVCIFQDSKLYLTSSDITTRVSEKKIRSINKGNLLITNN